MTAASGTGNGGDPGGGECRFVELPGGGSVCYAEFGDPAGRPCLLFHGWPSARVQGRLLDAPARRRGWRVIAPDRPGVGGTPFEPGRTLADAPGWTRRLLDALRIGGRVAVIGYSGGAPYVYSILKVEPEWAGPAAVVSGAVPLADLPDQAALNPVYRSLIALRARVPKLLGAVLGAGGKAAGSPVFQRLFDLAAAGLPPADQRAVASPFVRGAVLDGYIEATRQGGGAAVAEGEIYIEPWGFQLEEIRRPVDLWHGAEDAHFPLALVREIERRLPNASTRWLADEGHYSTLANRGGEILDALGGSVRG